MTQATAFDRFGAQLQQFEETYPTTAPTPKATPMPAQDFALRRTGQRPLKFTGSELCMAMSYVPGTPFWYEVNVYRTTSAAFVVQVRFFYKSEDEKDHGHVTEFPTFDDVLDFLETYDAAKDIRVDFDVNDESVPFAQVSLQAFRLRARVEEARRQFRTLVGQLTYELGV